MSHCTMMVADRVEHFLANSDDPVAALDFMRLYRWQERERRRKRAMRYTGHLSGDVLRRWAFDVQPTLLALQRTRSLTSLAKRICREHEENLNLADLYDAVVEGKSSVIAAWTDEEFRRQDGSRGRPWSFEAATELKILEKELNHRRTAAWYMTGFTAKNLRDYAADSQDAELVEVVLEMATIYAEFV